MTRVGLLVLLASCNDAAHPAVLYPPHAVEGSAAAVAKTDVDTECLWSAHHVLCTVEADHVITARADARLRLVSVNTGARSVAIDGTLFEPYRAAGPLELTVAAGTSTAVRAVTEIELSATDDAFEARRPYTIWTATHPRVATERGAYEFSPIRYCIPGDEPLPTFRRPRMPRGIEATRTWQLAAARADECPELDDRSHARTATLALRRDVPLITNGGPRLSAGYVIREGWAAEVGYDLAVWRAFAFQAIARIDSHGELDAIAMFGLPLVLKVGVPIDTATGDLALRIQFYEVHFSFPTWPAAPGVVFFYEDWQHHPNRWGFLASVAF